MASRGKNFTEREKCKLLELVQKYKNTIENKTTNAVSILQKNEAWACLTSEFNSTAEMPRSQKQLHTAYLNLKRSTRQNIANQNIKKYLDNKHNEAGPSQMDESQNEMAEITSLLKQFKKDEIADKKGVITTGGGVYKPVLSSIGAQMLAVMGDQVTPLSNNCDSASSYYNYDEDMMTSNVANQDIILQVIDNCPDVTTNDCIPKPIPVKKIIYQSKNKPKIRRNMKQMKTNNDSLKRQYYLKKMECAVLEKKTRLLKYKMAIKKQKILDFELKIEQKDYENILNK